MEERSERMLYAAFRNNPCSYIDPDGRQLWAPPGTIPTIPYPISGGLFESIRDKWFGSDRVSLNENFLLNPRTAPAVEAMKRRLKHYMENAKSELCRDNSITLPDRLYSGSAGDGANEKIGRLEAVGDYPLEFYNIPQSGLEVISWLGGLDWLINGPHLERGCCKLNWRIDVVVLDKLGSDNKKYDGGGVIERLGGQHEDENGPRFFERARFSVSGEVDCCE